MVSVHRRHESICQKTGEGFLARVRAKHKHAPWSITSFSKTRLPGGSAGERLISEKQTPSSLFLVRHGQDLDNSRSLINGRRDTPLTDLGRTQALGVAEQLRSEVIRCIYSSPLQRARQTASIISERLGIGELDVDSDLIERDYGLLTGRSPADIPEYATRTVVLNDFRYVIESPGVEPYAQLWIRARNALRRIHHRHAGQGVLIVAHNEVLKMIRANFHGKSWEDELRLPPLNNCEVIVLAARGGSQ